MTTSQTLSGILLLAIIIVVIATVGPNPAVIVALGVAVALYVASVAKPGPNRS